MRTESLTNCPEGWVEKDYRGGWAHPVAGVGP